MRVAVVASLQMLLVAGYNELDGRRQHRWARPTLCGSMRVLPMSRGRTTGGSAGCAETPPSPVAKSDRSSP
jgi:hypothetical protein